jgi:3-dehydroquinate synthase
MNAERITVKASAEYEVIVGRGVINELSGFAAKRRGKVAVVSDTNVAPFHLGKVSRILEAAGCEVTSHVFPAGEGSKNLETLGDILESLAAAGLSRRDLVIALGGGVVGDVTALAAALYMRGVDYVQIPTSLLAAVDSSVGGKCAVDLRGGKNLAGVFKQPALVLCDFDLIDTLPDAELSNGMAEVIKYGLGFDASLFKDAARGGRENAYSLIARCVEIKKRVVEKDEFDLGERAKLNLGHTAGHAIEKLSNYAIPHGAAVAMGSYIITRSFLPEAAKELAEALAANGLKATSPYGAEELAKAALSDKKRAGSTISLVVPTALGACEVREEPIDGLCAIFSRGGC